MILLVMTLLLSLSLVLGLIGPLASNEIRTGRLELLSLQTRRATEGGLADFYGSPWIDSTVGRLPGQIIGFDSAVGPSGIVMSRRLESLVNNLWLFEIRAVWRDRGGRLGAAWRAGWIARVDSFPSDSTRHSSLIRRFFLPGFQ